MVGSGVVEGKERWRCSGREGAVSAQWEKGRKEHDEGRSCRKEKTGCFLHKLWH
jgi:hypothetical protein